MKKFERKTKDERRRVLLSKNNELSYTFDNEKLPEENSDLQANRKSFARPNGSALFLKGADGAVARTPISKRMLAIILAIVMIAGLIPAGIFVLRPKAEGMNDLGPVEMILRVNGEEQGTVQMQPGVVEDHIDSVTIENAPAKLEFEGAFLVDRSKTPVTETRISSVGSYKGDDYYALGENNNTGIKKASRQELVLVYSSEYDVTTNPGEGGTIEVDDTVPYGTDLHVTVTAPKGHSVDSVTYTIGDASYTATVNSNGDFTIPGSQVVNDITISSTYSQIETFTVKDARKVQNSKYYNLYGLEGHGGITATIGVSAENQPYNPRQTYFADYSDNKYLLYTPDAVLRNGRWNGTYTRSGTTHAVYGAPATPVYVGYNNIVTNSNGTIADIQPNSVANGAGTTFYLYSQSKSGDSNGWGLNMLSINGEEIEYPVETTIGASRTHEMQDGSNVTVTLIDTDGGLYWNSGDYSYSNSNLYVERYYSKDNIASYSSSDVANLRYYNAPTQNKHRYIYQVDIDHVRDNLEVAYNFKDVSKRKIIITGLKGIDETGAAYEYRGHNVNSSGSTSALDVRVIESRDYYFANKNNSVYPSNDYSDDENDLQQNEYDAFYFEQYGNGATFVPSANVYVYRVKTGYNPYSVDASARYVADDGTVIDVPKQDLLAGPQDGAVGTPENVLLQATEANNQAAQDIIDNASLPDSWKEDGALFPTLVREYMSFNSLYRFWGTSSVLKHGDTSTRSIRAGYTSSTHATPNSNKTNNILFLDKIHSYEGTLQTQNIKNYNFYALALQQNEAKIQTLRLNANPYQYNVVFDANGGAFPASLQTGYAPLANGEFADEEFYTSKTANSVKQSSYFTLENGNTTTHMPKQSMQPERQGYFFAGWRLYQNGNPVDIEGYDEVYSSNEAFSIDENSIGFSEGDETKDADHTFTFKAQWIKVADPEEMAHVSVSVYKQTGSKEDKTPDYTNGTIIEDVVEAQIAGDTVLLNQHKPSLEEYYVLDEAESKIETRTQEGSLETNTDNQLKAYFKWRSSDLTILKRVSGNPKTLKDGFEITILLTKDLDSPVNAVEAAAMIAVSNPDNITLTDADVNENDETVTFVGTFGRSNEIVLQNVPYGWTATVSEPKATVVGDETPDYTTSITTNPEGLGTIDEEDTTNTTWSGRITQNTKVTVTNDSESFLILDKSISRNESGTYDLQLEAYATGGISSEKKTEKIPTDFVVIVDQSGSMAINDMATGFTPVSDEEVTLEEAANGSYYYYDSNTKEHYKVYGKKGDLYHYYPANYWYVGDIIDRFNTRLRWFMPSSESTTTFENQFFFREVVNGKAYYQPITTTVQGKVGTYYIGFKYDSKLSGRTVKFDREVTTYTSGEDSPWYHNLSNIGGRVIKPGWSVGLGWPDYSTVDGAVQGLYSDDNAYTFSEVSIFGWRALETGMYVNYPMYDRHNGYTGLYYRDINGVEHALKTIDGKTKTEFCDAQGDVAWTTQEGSTQMKYSNLEIASGTTKRLDALDTALNAFAEEVANETDEVHGSVDNKIAIVGFSSKNEGTPYNNTEVLTGSPIDSSQAHASYSETNYYYFPYQGADYTPAGSTGTNYNGPQYYQYSSSSDGYTTAADATAYKNALVNSTNGTVGEVNSNITDAIKSISAWGGTKPADGFKMAYQILQNREVKTYKLSDGTVVPRNTFVIYFTDGRPGNFSFSDQYEEANAVVKSAKKVKDLGATVFSIGVFDESDGNPLTYSKYEVKNSQGNITSRNRTDGYSSENLEKEYDLTWVETYPNNGAYYYLNREWIESNPDEYGATPNDTIADYMSVVSSNYPNAEGFTSDKWISYTEDANWATMTASVRGEQISEISEGSSDPIIVNKYYRMASNQATLIEAFQSAITTYSEETSIATTGMDGTTALLRDVINGEDFEIPEHPEDVFTVNVYTQKGDQLDEPPSNDNTAGIDFHNNDWDEITNDEKISIQWKKDADGNAYVDVSGFDYGANFIAHGKPENNDEGTATHEGKKLIVTISGLVPKKNSTGELQSNTADSGIYKLVAGEDEGDPKAQQMDAFVSPTMERYAYKVTEPHEYTEDTFNVNLTRGGSNADSSAASSILVTYNKDNGKREEHLVDQDDGNTFNWTGVQNGDIAYWELLNNSNKDETSNTLTATVLKDGLDEVERTYQLDLIDSDGTNTKDPWTNIGLKHENSTLQVTNVTNYRDVTITEETRGVEGQADYSDKEHQFPIQMTLKNGTDGVTTDIQATITRQKDGSTNPITLEFKNGVLKTDVKLANGDKIEFEVLNGYTLTVLETAEDAGQYDVSYDPDDDTEVEGTVQTIGDTNFIKVINTLHENPDISSGVLDENNPFGIILAVLAGICGLAAAGTVVYRKRKPEET